MVTRTIHGRTKPHRDAPSASLPTTNRSPAKRTHLPQVVCTLSTTHLVAARHKLDVGFVFHADCASVCHWGLGPQGGVIVLDRIFIHSAWQACKVFVDTGDSR